MKPLTNTNELRMAARAAAKSIKDLGSPYGPDEAFVFGAIHAEKLYLEAIFELEAEIEDLRKKAAKND